ncbi:hypothetical protein ACIHFD_44230 [Nonomuraea sp. NPDC051941]|uniref:hypothetical protein n=1 Tax=Nonomuraea sp. NPDC051941 TaxID=3364373 RepID=UPI0037C7FEEB
MEAIAMGSLQEELARREAAARERVARLRQQPAAAEEMLSRLVITRETVEEILGESADPVEPWPVADEFGEAGGREQFGDADEVASGSAGSPIGVITVPRWRPGMKVLVLPRAYQDVLEVLADADGAMRAGKIVVALGCRPRRPRSRACARS